MLLHSFPAGAVPDRQEGASLRPLQSFQYLSSPQTSVIRKNAIRAVGMLVFSEVQHARSVNAAGEEGFSKIDNNLHRCVGKNKLNSEANSSDGS